MDASVIRNTSVSTATNLLPALKALQKHEKLFIIQFLVGELSREEHQFFVPGGKYPIWSPIGAHSAAEKLLEMLANEKA